jgi:type I restriction enzyme M protein
VIVPNGIVATTQNAYVKLRRFLVEDSLVAVVSLPAGIFRPYSGVKTSILFFDKKIARRTKEILFLKVTADGFDLGDKRQPIEASDLPDAERILKAWFRDKLAADTPSCVQWKAVEKRELLAHSSVSLSAEPIFGGKAVESSAELVLLGEVANFCSGGTPSKANAAFWRGDIPWVSPKDMKSLVLTDTEDHITLEAVEKSASKLLPAETILCVVRSGILQHTLPVAITARPMCTNQDILAISPERSRLDPRFLLFALKGRSSEILRDGIKTGVTVQSFHNGFFKNFQILLPSLEEQRRIVAEIEGYQKIIDGARQVLGNYRPSFAADPNWPIVPLADVTKQITDGTHFTPTYTDSGVPFWRVTDITKSDDSKKFISRKEHLTLIKRCHPEKGDILYSKNGTVGVAKRVDWDFEFSIFVSLALLKPQHDQIDSRFLEYTMNSAFVYAQAMSRSKSNTVTNLHLVEIRDFQIPLPSFQEQRRIVAELDAEAAQMEVVRALIPRYEAKIQKVLDRVWRSERPEAEAE